MIEIITSKIDKQFCVSKFKVMDVLKRIIEKSSNAILIYFVSDEI